MINFTYSSLFIVFIIFIILFILNKSKKNFLTRTLSSIIDSTTLSSGIILFLYLCGKAFSIDYLTNLDEFSLGLALLIASLVLISVITDKYYKLGKRKKW